MKKLLYLFGASLLVLSSCSSDSSDSIGETILLIKEITSDSYGGTHIITYDGNKIVKEERSATETNTRTYIYDGDLIIKEKIVRKNGWDFWEITSVEYNYENGKLTSLLSKSSDSWTSDGTSLHDRNNYKFDYVYNSDGTITAKNYTFDSQGNAKILYLIKYFFQNGNLVKSEYCDIDGTILSTSIYKYDNKTNPFSNIVGFGQLYDQHGYEISKNNLVEYTLVSSTYTKTVKNKYTYNSNGYPEKISTSDVEATNNIPSNTHFYNTEYHY
ncbi:hypothetical protein [Flavobacterium laiguense]|uniref:DUF4595 domain-containing protein n=1 Tax=Flavobacterium laiguense TaxID=2169409 RepID=A0A2U1JS34_9FLAO|nr:hypothetical protein [Flavobacterium laiguense]PWA07769.1 hypothetical protein DB891_14005 [Flavobacterium laiguense]